ncbi:exocyst complex component Sec6-domain-containing protein [Suillus variegatus]|nr:exocyst complex component Sec6-domain-containing protein [Suillus variegatus]KAG1797611.1 exocyst complex component Sec6-domain-containing protein [Suillus variegatus]
MIVPLPSGNLGCNEVMVEHHDPSAFLGGLSWIYQDLICIESDVVPFFPPSYEMHAFYIKEYHRPLNATLQRIIESEPDASIMHDLHAWIKEYKKSMTELNVVPELLDPPLLGGEQQNLIENYLKLIVKKLDEWSANLMKTEIREFITRSDPPGVDSDGLFGTQGVVILFQMVNQQIDAATESGQGAILARVVGEDRWTKVAETKEQTEKPEEVVRGLAEYCIPTRYDGIMEQIVLTMRNYMADQSCINPSLLELLVEDLLGAFLVTYPYLTALVNCPKLCIAAATERIKEDISTVFSFFSAFKPTKELEPYFEVVDLILVMLEASKSLAFLSFGAFAKVHGPCIPFVEGLMKVRGDDFDRSAVSEVMDSIKRKVKGLRPN